MDRYAYVNNSPINYIDPSGHRSCDDQDEKANCITYKDPVKLTQGAKDLIKFAEDVGLSPLEVIEMGISHEIAGWAYDSDNVKTFGQNVSNRFVWYSRNNCGGSLTYNCELNYFMATYQSIKTSFVDVYKNRPQDFLLNETWGKTYQDAGESVMNHFWENVDPSYDPDHNFEDWDKPFNVGVAAADALEAALGNKRPVVGTDFLVISQSMCGEVRSYSFILSYGGTKFFENLGLGVSCE